MDFLVKFTVPALAKEAADQLPGRATRYGRYLLVTDANSEDFTVLARAGGIIFTEAEEGAGSTDCDALAVFSSGFDARRAAEQLIGRGRRRFKRFGRYLLAEVGEDEVAFETLLRAGAFPIIARGQDSIVRVP